MVSRSRADALASLARSVCSPGAFQSSSPPSSSLPSPPSQHVLARGPARRNEHTMSSDEPFHSLFTATGSIDGIWPFLQSVSLVRPFPLSFLSPLFFIFLSLSLSCVLLLRPVVTPPPLVAVVFRSAVTVLRQSSNLFSLSLPPYTFTRPYGHFVLRQLTAYRIRISFLPSIAAASRSSLAFRTASGAVCQMSRG